MTNRHLYSSEPQIYVEIPLGKDEEFRSSWSYNEKITQVFGSAPLAARDDDVIDVSSLKKAPKKQNNKVPSKTENLLKDVGSNKRYCIFTWLQLEYFHEANFSEASAGNPEEMLKDIAFFISKLRTSRAEELSEKLMESYLNNAINPEKVKWLTKTPRSIRWALRKLIPFDTYKISRLPNLTGQNLLLATLDLSHLALRKKDLELNSLKSYWQENIKSDIHLEWFKAGTSSESKHRRDLFWSYVCKKHTNRFDFDHTPTKHEDIEEICDQLSEAGFTKKSITQAVKKKEEEARAGTIRKKKCFALSLSAHDQFAQLKLHYQMNEQALIEKLIADACAACEL